MAMLVKNIIVHREPVNQATMEARSGGQTHTHSENKGKDRRRGRVLKDKRRATKHRY